MAIEIVDFPMKNGDVPLLFVCSPEGTTQPSANCCAPNPRYVAMIRRAFLLWLESRRCYKQRRMHDWASELLSFWASGSFLFFSASMSEDQAPCSQASMGSSGCLWCQVIARDSLAQLYWAVQTQHILKPPSISLITKPWGYTTLSKYK